MSELGDLYRERFIYFLIGVGCTIMFFEFLGFYQIKVQEAVNSGFVEEV